MKKIAIIIPGYVPVPAINGGAVEKLVTHLINQNSIEQKVTFDLYTMYFDKIKDYSYKNTNIISVKLNKLDILYEKIINKFYKIFNLEKNINIYCNKSLKILMKKEYDFILIENNMYNYQKIYKLIHKRNSNTKFIFHLHNDIGKIDKPLKLCKFIDNSAYKVLTCSEFLKFRLEELGCKKAEVLYNVIDFNNFYFDEQEQNIKRKELNIKNNYLFCYIGRISPEKGLYELILSFKKLLKKYNNVSLLIIGDTLFKNNKNAYYSKILKVVNPIKNNVIFLGHIDNDNLYKYISTVDCIIIPTICEEAFGMVALEAICCEKPVIATNSGGLKEILRYNTTFLISKNNIINNLANKMEYVIINDKKLKNSVKENKEKILKTKNFDKNYYLDNFINIILEGDLS